MIVEADVHQEEKETSPPPMPNTQNFLEEEVEAVPPPKKINQVSLDDLQGCPLTLLIQEACELTDMGLMPLLRTFEEVTTYLETNPDPADDQMEYKWTVIHLLVKKVIKENYSPRQLKTIGIDSLFPHLLNRELSTMFISLVIGSGMKRAFLRSYTTPPKKPPTVSSVHTDDTFTSSMCANTKRVHAIAESPTESDDDSEEAVFGRYTKRKRSTQQDGIISQNISYKKKGRRRGGILFFITICPSFGTFNFASVR